MASLTSPTVCGLGRLSTGRPSAVRSGFMGKRVSVASRSAVSAVREATVMSAGKEFDKNWLNANPIVLVLGVVGWCVPSSIGVPAYGGSSLTASFFASIGEELAHFPTGPSIDSNFWLYMVTWHLGLFLCLTLGQIGWNGRKQGYFP